MRLNNLTMGFVIGSIIGIGFISYAWSIIWRGLGDAIEAASWILFLFGLPATLVEDILVMHGIVKSTDSSMLSLSILCFLNWSVIGSIGGWTLGKILFRQ